MQKIELLAPAGSLDKLKMAVRYGADAVYLGATAFSLREQAENFTPEEMEEGIAFAHTHGVKAYVAMNIFPHNKDLPGIAENAKMAYQAGADAIIVADLGAFCVVREAAPELDVHISTQANNVNYRSVSMWHRLGAKRVILARELSFDEILEVREKAPSDLELEVFVHGAMCMSYSGRCLLSNYLASRDSNQGNCAQPCRWKYYLMEEKRPGEYMPIEEHKDGTFIFNAKDLCMIEYIPELIKSGISSVKIEGRVKSEYYVASVVKAYREAIDSYYADPVAYTFAAEHKRELEKVSHRDYGTGFFLQKPRSEGQIYNTSSYIREYDIVAMVLGYDSKSGIATIEQRNKFQKGDLLEIIQPRINGYIAHLVEELTDEQGSEVLVAPHPQQILKIKTKVPLLKHSILRKEKQ